MTKPFPHYQGPGKKCRMIHKSDKDYDRKNKEDYLKEEIESYQETTKDFPSSSKKTIEGKFNQDKEGENKE